MMCVKLKDGLWIGDAESSQNLEELEKNHISWIVNCAGRELDNHFPHLRYLTFSWDDAADFVLFDAGGVVLEQICSFVDDGLRAGESVLLHDVMGGSRCVAASVAYFLARYGWSLEKALAFHQAKQHEQKLEALEGRFPGRDVLLEVAQSNR